MRGREDLRAHLLATFKIEAEDHLVALAASLQALASGLSEDGAREELETTFREMHTLKGAARSVGLTGVEAACQACEAALSALTQGRLELGPSLLAGLQEAVDGIARLIDDGGDHSPLVARLEAAVSTPGAPAPPRAHRAEPLARGLQPSDTLRIPAARLDALFAQVEELLVAKLAAADRVRDAAELAEALSRGGGAAARNGAAGADPRALEKRAHAVAAHLARDQRRMAGAVDALQDETRRLRMTPVAAVLDLFPRMVRDLADEHGNEIEWVARGAELEVDRRVLEAVKDPLIHLVRNAIAHGIEPPDERVAAGKARRGRVEVAVGALEGGLIEIAIEDDGRGVDLEAVRAAAGSARLAGVEEAAALSDEQAIELLFRSGLSTSPIVTDVSGHGLGLAIVKERVERLDGTIRVLSRPGAGTVVRLALPATIAAFHGLLVEAGRQPFLIPAEAVERALRVAPDTLARVNGRDAVRWNGAPVPLARLDRILELGTDSPPAGDGEPTCVIVRWGDERAALVVDDVLGEREVLVKELGAPLRRVRNVAGAGLLGTGRLVPVLRPADLVRSALRAAAAAPPVAAAAAEERERVVLVVDDSITTRTMEKNLLESAGYRVVVAADGIEAWTLLRSEPVDLVVSDVDMPRLDGFGLTERIRADRDLAELPVVLVTALESREDMERGIEVGANAYIVKSSFEQSRLLELIQRFA